MALELKVYYDFYKLNFNFFFVSNVYEYRDGIEITPFFLIKSFTNKLLPERYPYLIQKGQICISYLVLRTSCFTFKLMS